MIGDEASMLVDGMRVTLEDIRNAKGTVLKFPAKRVKLSTEDRDIEVTADTGYFMLWSPAGSKLLCVEPVTRRPNTDDPMQVLGPNEMRRYTVGIRL